MSATDSPFHSPLIPSTVITLGKSLTLFLRKMHQGSSRITHTKGLIIPCCTYFQPGKTGTSTLHSPVHSPLIDSTPLFRGTGCGILRGERGGQAVMFRPSAGKTKWWAHLDSNQGPRRYEHPALTTELWAHLGMTTT